MHPTIYRTFEDLLAEEAVTGAALEIGLATNFDPILASPVFDDVEDKVGLDLESRTVPADMAFVQGNGNAMAMFDDDTFDCVVSNATLEHDRYFWRTLAEIRRVAKPGAVVALGVPGFGDTWKPSGIPRMFKSAPTFRLHGEPDDFWRFSKAAVRDVFLEGMDDVEVREVLRPPRFVGKGTAPALEEREPTVVAEPTADEEIEQAVGPGEVSAGTPDQGTISP